MFYNCLDMVEGLIVFGHQFPTKDLLDDDNDVFIVQRKFAISSINKLAIVPKKKTKVPSSFRSTTNATKKFVEKPKMLKAKFFWKRRWLRLEQWKPRGSLTMNKVKSGTPLNTIVSFPPLPYESHDVKMFYVKPMDFITKQEKVNLLIFFFLELSLMCCFKWILITFVILMFLVITYFA